MNKEERHKPVIETIVNSVALALTAFGVNRIYVGDWTGYLAITFGVGLEYFKYHGRLKKLW